MCEPVIGSSRAMQDLQTGPHWCESVAPSLVTLEQRGAQAGHVKSSGRDGYLSDRVTASGSGALEGGGHRESPPLSCSHREPLFLQGTPPSQIPFLNSASLHRGATLCSREKNNLQQLLLPTIQSPSTAAFKQSGTSHSILNASVHIQSSLSLFSLRCSYNSHFIDIGM